MTINKKKLALLFVLSVVAILFIAIYIHLQNISFNPIVFAKELLQYGPFSIFLYIAVMITAVVTPIPDSIVSIAGIYLFGFTIGSVLSLIGLIIGTTFDFWLARKLGRKFVEKKFPKSIKTIDRYVKHLGWQTIILLRFTPTVTFDLVGYAAGISSMPYFVFVTANILGGLPTLIISILIGKDLRNFQSINKLILLVDILVIVILTLSVYFISRRSKRDSH